MEEDRKRRTAALYFLRAALIVMCFWKWKIEIRALLVCVFLLLLSYIAEQDIYTRRIPDYLVLGAGAAGLISVPLFPEISLASRGAGAIGVSILLLAAALIIQGSFGGGDIKLMAASGMFLGWNGNFRAFAAGVFLAGIYCGWMLLRGRLNLKAHIALGPFLCAGIAVEVFCFLK